MRQPWGKLLSVTDVNGDEVTNPTSFGHLNPFRYRCYYYDTESGLYYLQSRYYDPENGRFINADTIAGNTGNSTYNLFVYCANNPIMNADPTGLVGQSIHDYYYQKGYNCKSETPTYAEFSKKGGGRIKWGKSPRDVTEEVSNAVINAEQDFAANKGDLLWFIIRLITKNLGI